jgi:hypothetical protein
VNASPRERYHYDDFTLDSFRALLRRAKETHPPATYADYLTRPRCAVWRHDIDVSVHRALAMARVESEEGVRAHYFVALRLPFYNVLERDIARRIAAIAEAGHAVGLHFDASDPDVPDAAALERRLAEDAALFRTAFGFAPRSFSFHIPARAGDVFTADAYAGMLNVYSRRLREGLTYCSDSNGYWRHRRLHDLFAPGGPDRIHALLHPEYYPERVMSPKERIWGCFDGRAARSKEFFEGLLRAHGRELIDG